MTYENYVKFLNACETDLDKEKYYLQKKIQMNGVVFSKIRMNGTTLLRKIQSMEDA